MNKEIVTSLDYWSIFNKKAWTKNIVCSRRIVAIWLSGICSELESMINLIEQTMSDYKSTVNLIWFINTLAASQRRFPSKCTCLLHDKVWIPKIMRTLEAPNAHHICGSYVCPRSWHCSCKYFSNLAIRKGFSTEITFRYSSLCHAKRKEDSQLQILVWLGHLPN